jgi:predicted glutamine amidotransferase
MCRMILAIGNFDPSEVIDNAISMAKDQNTIHELNEEKGQGSWTHEDGWGVAYLQDEKWRVSKSTEAIFKDPAVNKFRLIKTSMMILHVRKKMGSEKHINNTHPFHHVKTNPGTFVFCHNGFIDEDIFYGKEFKPQGQTDSEKLFYSILTDMKKDKIAKAIRKNFKRYKELTGTNIILSNKEKSVVAVRQNHFPRYYQMQMAHDENKIIISSEAFKNSELNWEPLEQGDIINIKNKQLVVSIYKNNESIIKRTFSKLKRKNS